MIIKNEKKGNIMIYHVDKDISDEKMKSILNTKLKRSQIPTIIDHDADIYTKEGKLLARFRKDVLKKANTDSFYENVIKFAKTPTTNRGSASSSKKKNIWDNEKIMTNIIGYFDKFGPKHKQLMREQNKTFAVYVRETRFNIDYPEKYKKLMPLVKEIDTYYEKLIPENYAKQKKKANQTPFKIPNTAFTTITTNVNFQTSVHTDKGDDDEGFGNLVIIEKGKYKGGETCIPQYGLGINARTGDILFMDVHEPHGNLPILLETPDAIRLSIVCYLRKNIWVKTKGKTKKFMIQHNKSVRNLRKQ